MGAEAKEFSQVLTKLYRQYEQRGSVLPPGYYSVGYFCADPSKQLVYWESTGNNQATINVKEPTDSLPIPADMARKHKDTCQNPKHTLFFRAIRMREKDHFLGEVKGER